MTSRPAILNVLVDEEASYHHSQNELKVSYYVTRALEDFFDQGSQITETKLSNK